MLYDDDAKKLLKKFGFEEQERMELARNNPGDSEFVMTSFPQPIHKYRLVLESHNRSIEDTYFWVLDAMRLSEGFHHIKKITDIFSASEQSSMFGTAQQRLSIQQDRAGQYLTTIAKLIRELFQIVREIRMLKENLEYYHESFNKNAKGRETADMVLKDKWATLVEGGSKNPGSVYGLQQQLQFATLPDLFFSIHPFNTDEIDSKVDKIDFNRKVKEVLKRKLHSFIKWKEETYKEYKTREQFMLKFLEHHHNVIKMYISWVKPYIRNVNRLSLGNMDKDPDLVSAFEGSMIEIELLFYKLPVKMETNTEMLRNKKIYAVVIAHFSYRTKPVMSYSSPDYSNKGPLHVGKVDLILRAYSWNKKQIDSYEKMRDRESLDMIGSLDSSIGAAMDELGEEFNRYLDEARAKRDEHGNLTENEKIDKEHKKEQDEKDAKEKKKMGMINPFEPFMALFSGLPDFIPHKKKPEMTYEQENREKKVAQDLAKRTIWQIYKNYKKGHKHLAW